MPFISSPCPVRSRHRAAACHGASAAHGFTLIELLVVLALAGMLAAIAMPSYRNIVLRNQRAEGRAALLQTMLLQERHFSANRSYAAFSETSAPPAGFSVFSGASQNASAYRIEAAACPDEHLSECVHVIATPRGFDDTVCGALSIDSRGRQLTGNAAALTDTQCWPS